MTSCFSALGQGVRGRAYSAERGEGLHQAAARDPPTGVLLQRERDAILLECLHGSPLAVDCPPA